MKILCGDIGGTKTLLQLADVDAGKVLVIDQQRYSSINYDDFYQIVAEFLVGHPNLGVDSACFGVAGPVLRTAAGQSATITNLPWQLDSETMASRFQIDSVTLINDFEAVGYGLEALSEDELVTLQPGNPVPRGNQLVIGAGTGLGVAQLIWEGDQYKVLPTEGGHADFAPANPLQLELAGYLMRRFGRGSVEHVLSGPGLVNLFGFVAERENYMESLSYQAIITSADPAAAVTESAKSADPLAMAAMDLFVEAYGAGAGNFALSSLALGGVYVAGGIAPKIIGWLKAPRFMDAFRAKGKMAGLMARMPVRVVMNPEVGLLGSRVVARRSAH